MQGLAIFIHAVRMVIGNFGQALRIGGVALAVTIVSFLLAGPEHFNPPQPGQGGSFFDRTLSGDTLLSIVQAVVYLWVAVAWHRYILLDEEPGLFAPRFKGSAIWSYFIAGLLCGLVIWLATIPLLILSGLFAMLVVAPEDPIGLGVFLVAMVLVLLPAGWLGARLAPMLPSAAIQKRLKLGEAWAATKGAGYPFMVLVFVTFGTILLINTPAPFLGDAFMPLGLLWDAAAKWLTIMVGASILTTIYGVYVEKRALNV
ncbi:hypothetical protein [Pararhodobacter aggregans]|uniref:hypothetical protein n=1 Tax=Pararhodobacter aggregans TaxID=404875 RepID=UPI003A91A8CC